MRILLLTHSFNSLCQRFFVELADRGHDVSVEFDINDAVSIEAVGEFKPDLIVAPYLKRRIPEAIWRGRVCLVVHPGPPGDRGPSALDWAILRGESEWGVTLLQADEEMDGGDVWASRSFAMRSASKSSLYRNEVTECAVRALLESIEHFGGGRHSPVPQSGLSGARIRFNPLLRQPDRRIDWGRETTEVVLRKMRASDGQPGVHDEVLGLPCALYDPHPEQDLRGAPGDILAQQNGAICRATTDGAVWIGHLRRLDTPLALKLRAARVLRGRLSAIREIPRAWPIEPGPAGGGDVQYEESGAIGFLHFPFYNGAMSTEQCRNLRDAFLDAQRRPTRVLVLMGGRDFWSNGIHLHQIEAAESPADASWENINAIDDLAREILTADAQVTVSALQGNAGAGGVFLSLASDFVYARSGVVLNPHYKAMGNLYGSEYWTYLLPKRVGEERAHELTELRLPLSAREATRMGLIDGNFGDEVDGFRRLLGPILQNLAIRSGELIAQKRARRAQDETRKSLESYRAEELDHMRLNFYGFDPSYHVARYNFVHRVPHSRTPLHLAKHRRGQCRNACAKGDGV